MKESWEQAFFNTMDGRIPEAPRQVQVALVESVQPFVVNMGDLLYEKDKGEVLVNHFLTKETYTDVTVAGCPEHGSFTGTITYQPELQVGDKVAVVQLEGLQQLIVLCKVV